MLQFALFPCTVFSYISSIIKTHTWIKGNLPYSHETERFMSLTWQCSSQQYTFTYNFISSPQIIIPHSQDCHEHLVATYIMYLMNNSYLVLKLWTEQVLQSHHVIKNSTTLGSTELVKSLSAVIKVPSGIICQDCPSSEDEVLKQGDVFVTLCS